MNRKNLVLSAAVLALASLAGCGEKKGDAKPEPTSAPAGADHAATAKTAAGIAAAATVLAAPGAAQAAPDVPSGTSPPPTVAEWGAASSANTAGANSAPHDCELKVVREWMKVNCTGKIKEVTNMEGFGTKGVDYFELLTPGKVVDFVVRIKKGQAIKARILREDQSASLFMNWPAVNPKPSIVALQIFKG